MHDRVLIQLAQKGDNEAFSQVWRRYEKQVLAACRRYLDSPLRDPALDCHDLANETFIRALHNLDRYQDHSQDGQGFDVWLLEIAKNLCLNVLARQRRRRQWLTPDPEEELHEQTDPRTLPARLAEERESLRVAAQEINALPEIHRLPFKLFLEEFSHREIADTLGISLENSMLRVHRARRRLQVRLAGQCGFPSLTAEQAQRSSRRIEQKISEIVLEARIVTVPLQSGGELQICLRVDNGLVRREADIAARRQHLKAYPHAWKQRLAFAELCYHCGKWEEARDAYRAILAHRPACYEASLRLGQMLEREDRLEEAAQVYREALEQSPPGEVAVRLQAECALAEGRYSEAAEAFRAAIALAPQEKSNYHRLHAALGELSRYTEQLENLTTLRAIDQNDIFAYDAAYTPCARLQRWDIASPLLERAVEIDPNHPMALKHLFQVRMNLGRRDEETLALAERLVRLSPDFIESWSELAWILAERGRVEESLGVLQEFLFSHPGNAEAHAALAWRFHYLDRHEEAAICARRAYALAPKNWHVCWTLLVASKKESPAVSPTDAFHYVEEIAASFSQDAFILVVVCEFYRDWGYPNLAISYARRVRELQPHSVSANLLLPSIHLFFHDWQEAVAEYSRVLLLSDGRTVDTLISLGIALTQNQNPQAGSVIEEALSLAHTPEDFVTIAIRCLAYGHRQTAVFAMERYFLSPSTFPPVCRHAQALSQRLAIMDSVAS